MDGTIFLHTLKTSSHVALSAMLRKGKSSAVDFTFDIQRFGPVTEVYAGGDSANAVAKIRNPVYKSDGYVNYTTLGISAPYPVLLKNYAVTYLSGESLAYFLGGTWSVTGASSTIGAITLNEDKNFSLSSGLEILGDITLDLNGHSIGSTIDLKNSMGVGDFGIAGVTVTENAKLSIKDDSSGQTGKLTFNLQNVWSREPVSVSGNVQDKIASVDSEGFILDANGTKVAGISYGIFSTNGQGIAVKNGGVLNIEGGTIEQADEFEYNQDGELTKRAGIGVFGGAGASIYMTGGTVTSYNFGISTENVSTAKGTNISITGGTIAISEKYGGLGVVLSGMYDSLSVSGDSTVITNPTGNAAIAITGKGFATIAGGSISALHYGVAVNCANGQAKVDITGGTISGGDTPENAARHGVYGAGVLNDAGAGKITISGNASITGTTYAVQNRATNIPITITGGTFGNSLGIELGRVKNSGYEITGGSFAGGVSFVSGMTALAYPQNSAYGIIGFKGWNKTGETTWSYITEDTSSSSRGRGKVTASLTGDASTKTLKLGLADDAGTGTFNLDFTDSVLSTITGYEQLDTSAVTKTPLSVNMGSLSNAAGQATPVTLQGGPNGDNLTAGAGGGLLKGDGGDDTLTTGAGRTTLYGETGSDLFVISAGTSGAYIADYNVDEKDTVQFAAAPTSVALVGNDVVFDGKVTVANANGTAITYKASAAADDVTGIFYNNASINNDDPGTLVLYDNSVVPRDAKLDGSTLAVTLGSEEIKVNATTVKVQSADEGKTVSYTVENGKIVDELKHTATLTANYSSAAAYAVDKDVKSVTAAGTTDGVIVNGAEASNITIIGGRGADSLVGGLGDDSLFGGAGNDTFAYKSGQGDDTIGDYATVDTVNLDKPYTGFGVENDSDVVLEFEGNNKTLRLVKAVGKDITFNIGGTSSKAKFTADGVKISGKTVEVDDSFEGRYTATAGVETVDASKATKDVYLIGNALNNSLVGGSGNDSIDGKAGDDTLRGNAGSNTFIYSGGKDVIEDFKSGDSIRSTFNKAIADEVAGSGTVLELSFDDDNKLTINGVGGSVDIVAGNTTYSYDAQKVTDGKGATLYAAANNYTLGSDLVTLNGSNASSGKLTGNDKNNYIVASADGSTMDGAEGNDTLVGGDEVDTFVLSAGNDVFSNFALDDDKIGLGSFKATDFTDAASGKFTFGDGNTVQISGFGNKSTVELGSDATLTATGVILSGRNVSTYQIFKSAGGKKYVAGDSSLGDARAIDASNTARGVTLDAGEYGGSTLIGGTGNDVFVYQGGSVNISGFDKGDKVGYVVGRCDN